MRKLLLCPPDHYGIEYEINPWMDRTHKALPALAREQWAGLRDKMESLGCEVNLIAQDLTRYGWDAGSSPESRATLAQLLRAIGKADVDWIRLHYTFPSAFDDELIDVKQWDVIRVAPPVMRGFEAGPDGLEMIAVGGARPEEGDGEIVPGWWSD